MKVLVVLSVLLSGVLCEAPYPPSGWRPSGPAFELPQKPQKQEYLPPVEPRRPTNPNFDNGVDVSVQGLPSVERQPIFQLSPINGQQYNGPSINADIRNLDPSFQQIQYQQQQQRAQEFARQREFDARVKASNGLPSQQVPKQFAQTTTNQPEKTNAEPTTESFDLNQGESDSPKEQKNVTLEVTKQNIQEYPPELFLSPLAQFKLQSPFVPVQQFGQLRAPLYYQPIQSSDPQGFDGPAHLSVLAQKQLLEQQAAQPFTQSPIIVQEPLVQEPLSQYQPINQYQPQIQAYPQFQGQPIVLQPQAVTQVQPNQFAQPNQFVQPNQLAQPGQFQPNPQVQQADPDVESIEPNDQQIQVQAYPQYQTPLAPQPNQLQPIQPNQFVQPNPYAQPNQFVQPNQFPQPNQFAQPNQFIQPNQFPQSNQFAQPNQFIQPNQFPQPNQFVQPSQFVQPQFIQPTQPQQAELDAESIQTSQPQIVYQNYQPQYYQPNPYQDQASIVLPNQYAPLTQGQDALQSGLNDQQDNGLDTEEVDEETEGNQATAVATAFGARTQPRVVPSYGAPVPTYQTTESSQDENVTEDGPTVAQATAVATGRRKSAKLRSRRVRPVFTLDKSGHLVLAQE